MDKKILDLLNNGEIYELLELVKNDTKSQREAVKLLAEYHLTLQHLTKILGGVKLK